MKAKESIAARILTPFFVLLLVVIFIVEAFLCFLNFRFFNTERLIKSSHVNEIIEDYRDEFIENNFKGLDIDEDIKEETVDALLDRDFINLIVIEFWDASLYGDKKVDRDALEEAFEDATEELFEDYSDLISSKEAKRIKEEALDYIEDMVYEGATADNGSGQKEIIIELRDQSAKFMYILLLVSAVLIGILLLLYKNKARVIKFTGNAMVISQVVDILIMTFINIAVFEYLGTSGEDKEFIKMAEDVFGGLIQNAYIMFICILVLGIILIIIGKILSRSFNRVEEIE